MFFTFSPYIPNAESSLIFISPVFILPILAPVPLFTYTPNASPEDGAFPIVIFPVSKSIFPVPSI